MKFYRKLIALLISVITFCTVANAIDIVVNVVWQWLTIWTPGNIPLGSFSSSKEVTFTDYFWIEDLRASENGHYTSIQWLIYWADWEIVSGATVEFKSNSDSITLIWGVADNADFNRNMTNYTDITNPALLFYRNDNPSHSWYLNKYWFIPSIRVNVPNGSGGPYTVRLSYTLYDIPRVITAQ